LPAAWSPASRNCLPNSGMAFRARTAAACSFHSNSGAGLAVTFPLRVVRRMRWPPMRTVCDVARGVVDFATWGTSVFCFPPPLLRWGGEVVGFSPPIPIPPHHPTPKGEGGGGKGIQATSLKCFPPPQNRGGRGGKTPPQEVGGKVVSATSPT